MWLTVIGAGFMGGAIGRSIAEGDWIIAVFGIGVILTFMQGDKRINRLEKRHKD